MKVRSFIFGMGCFLLKIGKRAIYFRTFRIFLKIKKIKLKIVRKLKFLKKKKLNIKFKFIYF